MFSFSPPEPYQIENDHAAGHKLMIQAKTNKVLMEVLRLSGKHLIASPGGSINYQTSIFKAEAKMQGPVGSIKTIMQALARF